MFLVGSIRKAYIACAVLILITIPSAQPLEPRSPKPDGLVPGTVPTGPVRCGASLMPNGKGSNVYTCVDWDSQSYKCAGTNCYSGRKSGSAETSPLSKMIFYGCHYRDNGVDVGPPVNVHLYSFSNRPGDGGNKMDVHGWEKNPNDLRYYTCSWANKHDPNHLRPFCRYCTAW
ncbi:hypothetical protein MJO28_003454 [Puccinia striiformis f. sp. tritici]|uniref:Secreted protein n=2 Tax=Puccinia striiformis TaxID=27350 RepID=A0A2S4VG77_9BASI|nr:hypothetical protein MJO28_003454 [Puccinia striiformis f. sp. tritici]POW08551.1 hypothetical protein PSTT_07481 [Puccinia striiformis]